MVDFTYDSLASDIGTGTADGLRNLANTAANVYCDAYAAYAGAFAPASSPIGLVRGIDAFNSRLCSPRNKRPPPPTLPFTGGQCPVRYNVSYLETSPGGTNLPGAIFNVLGPISGVVVRNNASNQRVWGVQGAPDPPTAPDGFRGVFTANLDGNIGNWSLQVTNVVRVGGGADNCGDPNQQYPPKVAPSVSLNVPVTVDLGGFDLNATAIIIPTKFEANAEVNLGVEVQIGDFNIEFNAGGVNITNNFSPNVDINLPGSGTDGRPNPPTPKPVDPNKGECDLDQVETDLSEILELLEDIKDCACDNTEEVTVEYGVTDSGIYTSPALDIVECRVILTEVPSTVRTQSGNANAPEVYYAGWCSFGAGFSNFGERIPISYQGNSFIAPPGAVQFSFTLVNGARGYVVMTYKREKTQEL